MFCCGGAEEENAGPPANYSAPPRGNNPVGGNHSSNLAFLRKNKFIGLFVYICCNKKQKKLEY